VKAPEGTLVNPCFPAAVVGFPDVANRIYEVIMEALTPVMPDRVIAATSGTTTNTFFGGNHPTTGQPYVWYSINSQGGWGGKVGSDGWHNVCFIEANGWDIPAETIEYRYPWRVLEYKLRSDAAGAGQWRGGEGNYLALTPIDHDCIFTVNGDRASTPPYGVFGGKPGATARCTIRRQTGEVERVAATTMKADGVRLNKGDVIIIESTSGGGYGNPLERDVDLVRKDLRDGLISLESARSDYGVVADPKSFAIDREATQKLREQMWKAFEKVRDRLPTIDRKGYRLGSE
jgi:N-methylhydantoinase B